MNPAIAIGIAGLLVAALLVYIGSNAGKGRAALPERERDLLRALDALEGAALSQEVRDAITKRLAKGGRQP